MSELSNLIFHGAKHKITSPYGYRDVIETSGGNSAPFHNGVDYGTFNVKLPQYPIEDGIIVSRGIDWAYGGAKYVWIKYPRLGVKMLHYHLDSYRVKKGQAVNKNTIIGYTGKTGKATGIHLHLGLKLLSGGGYVDPEAWFEKNYTEPITEKDKTGTYKVTAKVLNVRSGPGTKYKAKKFRELSADAQKKILKLTGKKKNGYVKNMTFSVVEVCGNWGRTPSGWVSLNYCRKI
ncbi:MAG: M23 family metallopeptidase [Clostridia bacterium]|nr:M23 family metallopeptidase [Clostridia bacterium]